MNLLFNSPSWILSASVIVILVVLVCLGVLWVVKKNTSGEELKKSHDVAGFTFSIIGVLYSVILGFTVINAQSRYNTVQETIHTEAVLLADLYEDASFFSEKDRDAIRASLRQYIQHVVKEEWWLPEAKGIHVKTRTFIKDIWQAYYNIAITDAKIGIWYKESISKLNRFLNARLGRQFNTWGHLGSMMWSILIIGAVITVGFMFLFGLENMHSHMLMTAVLAGYLVFMLYLVFSLDHVFSGPQGIKPDALEQVYSLFNQWDQQPLVGDSIR